MIYIIWAILYEVHLTPIRESWKKTQKPGTELASFLEKNPGFFYEYLGMISLQEKILGTV